MFKKEDKKVSFRFCVLWIQVCLVLLLSISGLFGFDHQDQAINTQQTHPYAALYQSILDEFVRLGHPGVGALIRTSEEGTWHGGAGYACLEDRTPVSADHLFYSLSCTKAYTAAATLMLWEEGLIDLGACIDQYLPQDICDRIANGHSATVRQLLSHTSGIPDSDENRPIIEIINDPLAWTWRDDLEGIYDMPALFPPGTGLEYRASNFILLSLIIDGLVGDHALFFSTRIFQPLGLQNTFYKLEPGLPCPPNQVDIYMDRYGDGKIENVSEVICEMYYNVHRGSSGLIADLTDNAWFMESLIDGRLLSPEALDIMTAPSFPGYEWRGMGIGAYEWIDSQGSPHQIYEMAGSGLEGMVYTRYFPADGATISIATNLGSTNRENAHDLFDQLLQDLSIAVINLRSSGNDSENSRIKEKIRDRKK